MNNFLICGVGGQGTVLASKIIANTAILNQMEASTSETIGMAQKGGNVVSHVRIGKEAFSPIIPIKGADVVLAFEPGEAVNNFKYLKDDGLMIVNTQAVQPVTTSLLGLDYDGKDCIEFLKANVKNLILVDGKKICEQVGNYKVLNVAMIGVLCSACDCFLTLENVTQTLKENMAKKILDVNILALNTGYKIKG